jgi:hypothetical protein
VIDGTTDAARARVDRLERSELAPGVAADLDSEFDGRAQVGSQVQAGADFGADQQFNGSAQGPLPGDPAMEGQYEAGYRGVDNQTIQSGQASYQGQGYRLRHDRSGREFICVNGRAVYFDNQAQGQQQHEAYKLDSNQRMNQDRMNQDRMIPQQQGQLDYQSRQYQGGSQSGAYAPQGAPPAPPAPVQGDLNSSSPASPSVSSDTSINADQQSNLNESANIEADTRAGASADTNTNGASDSAADASADAGVSADTELDANSSDSASDASSEGAADIEADADASSGSEAQSSNESDEQSSSDDSGTNN